MTTDDVQIQNLPYYDIVSMDVGNFKLHIFIPGIGHDVEFDVFARVDETIAEAQFDSNHNIAKMARKVLETKEIHPLLDALCETFGGNWEKVLTKC